MNHAYWFVAMKEVNTCILYVNKAKKWHRNILKKNLIAKLITIPLF